MAVALHSYKVDSDGEIRVRHTFYGADEDECEQLKEQHARGCKAFGPAVESGDTIDIFEDLDEDELPDVDDLRDLEDEQTEDDDAEEGNDA